MSPSRAIILAAGNGSRMGQLTADRPKTMLEVEGRSLIDHALDALGACGIRDVTIVIGHQGQRLREHLGGRVRFVDNVRYRETNSLYSLSLARDVLRHGAVVLNSDVLVSPALVARLVEARVADAALVDSSSTLADEEMKVKIWNGFAMDFSKQLPPWEAHAENVGLLKFGAAGGRRLVAHIDALVAGGHENTWAPKAFAALAREWPIRAIDTGGLPWTEIDFPADLERARDMVGAAPVARRS
jgi:L-glutamine-phosphate cytidylyltransferase